MIPALWKGNIIHGDQVRLLRASGNTCNGRLICLWILALAPAHRWNNCLCILRLVEWEAIIWRWRPFDQHCQIAVLWTLYLYFFLFSKDVVISQITIRSKFVVKIVKYWWFSFFFIGRVIGQKKNKNPTRTIIWQGCNWHLFEYVNLRRKKKTSYESLL